MVRRLVLIGLISSPWLSWWYGQPHPQLTMLDVDQGLSVLVEDETGWQLLFDGGPDNSVVADLGQTMAPTDRYIDLIIISHQHRDHFVGLIKVLQHYQVGELWLAKTDSNDLAWQELKQIVQQRRIPFQVVKEGTVQFLSSGRKITVFHPPATPLGSATHDLDVIMTISQPNSRQTEMILTGDAEEHHEDYVEHCRNSLILTCPTTGAVLQVGHHGSKTSTSENWLKLIQPRAAWISVGQANPYNHPNSEVLQRLESFGIPYQRTDLNGTIKLDLE